MDATIERFTPSKAVGYLGAAKQIKGAPRLMKALRIEPDWTLDQVTGYLRGRVDVFSLISGFGSAVLLSAWYTGLDLTRKDAKLSTLLHYVATEDNEAEAVRKAQVLLQAGVDVNARDQEGNSALMLAAIGYKQKMAAWLIQRGAQPGCLMPLLGYPDYADFMQGLGRAVAEGDDWKFQTSGSAVDAEGKPQALIGKFLRAIGVKKQDGELFPQSNLRF